MFKTIELKWVCRNKSQTQIISEPIPEMEFRIEHLNDEFKCILPNQDHVNKVLNASFTSPDDAKMFSYYYWVSEHRRLIEDKIKNLNRQKPTPFEKMRYYQSLLI